MLINECSCCLHVSSHHPRSHCFCLVLWLYIRAEAWRNVTDANGNKRIRT